MDAIQAVELQIVKVNEEIDALSTEIKEAKEKINHAQAAGSVSEVQRWDKEREQLRKEREQLRKEKEQLRDEKAQLWSAVFARTQGNEGAGPSGDTEMPDADAGRTAGTRQTGAAAGPSRDRRRSNDDDWDDSVDEEVSKILERAFVSPEKNGQPELDLRPPPSSNLCARRDVSVVFFRESPSLLLTKLPGRNEDGLTNAQTLLAE
ncbi:hypothetical protein KFL_000970020 [Klebsormidium nitens]|uniref:Uncharacterized protein n=1 Tax=Klebsormidium nitens TaxID=105231 RepID=A0A0U9HJB3_KLENI|nr:hypothetical protein KFL_000970020 [Klebsormidium nitens]|eukprot:GAQ81978.1 hypothetical protein KFL_000970020 [Klebsormidium nitens]